MGWIILWGLDNLCGQCTSTSTSTVFLCSHGGACENLSAFWTELRRYALQPTARGNWRRLLLGCGAGFGIRRDDKRPCIIQRALSAAPVLLE